MRARFLLLLTSFAAPLAAGSQPSKLADASRDSVGRILSVLVDELGSNRVPTIRDFALGDRVISAGSTVQGSVGVYDGSVTVRGHVTGNLMSVNGDIVIAQGGRVDGDAVAVGGRVIRNGGTLSGGASELSGSAREIVAAFGGGSALPRTWRSVGVVATTLLLAVVMGVGVLLFANGHLAVVVQSMQGKFGLSFVYGVIGQLALLPALLLLLVALALTVIGLLLIPFAIVAFVLAVLGVAALGFLASAQITGLALTRSGSFSQPERRASLNSLVLGIFIYAALWMLAAVMTPVPVAGALARAFALVATWVAVTAGFGAAIASRIGRRRSGVHAEEPEMDSEASWLTPTPVTGVAAARRPAPTPSTRT